MTNGADVSGQEPLAVEVRRLLAEMEARLGERLNGLSRKIDENRDHADRTYLKKETWDESRKGDDRRFGELERDNSDQAGFRRQILIGILLILCTTVATAVLAAGGFK
jgi:hypothetical protein